MYQTKSNIIVSWVDVIPFRDKLVMKEMLALKQIRTSRLKASANQYTYPNFEFTLGKSLGSIPLDVEDKLHVPLIHVATKVLQALNANNIISHIELFVTPWHEIILLEASARPPGALLNLTHRINFGINLMDEDFHLQTGLPAPQTKFISNEKAFFMLFPLKAGKVTRLNEPKVKSRYELTWLIAEQDYIEPAACTNIVNKTGQAIFYNESIAQLKTDFERIKHHQAIEVV